MMKRSLVSLWLLFLTVSSCQTVPVTGRQQLSLIPASEIHAMSLTSYKEFLSNHEVITGTRESETVRRVGTRISSAVETYFGEKGMPDRLKGYQWEFNLVKDTSVNAWAMPGGKVVVYTGILPVTENDAGLAVVMGHEIGHAVANHGNERMSQGLLVQMGGMALSAALAAKPQQTQQLFMTAFGLGTQVGVLLPYSRLQESEADYLGLVFMAIAGYDPHAAVGFWERMEKAKKGESLPAFLSTHPSDKARIENIKALTPEAMKYYRNADRAK